jgi:hypothetical protein
MGVTRSVSLAGLGSVVSGSVWGSACRRCRCCLVVGWGRAGSGGSTAGREPMPLLLVPDDLHEVVHRHVEAPQMMVLVDAAVQELL